LNTIQYLGGKSRISKQISEVINNEVSRWKVKNSTTDSGNNDVIIRIFDICGYYGIDIAEAIKIKHSFNKNRPYRHGGKIL